jgi:glycosyltransferase involved in cell wall biosynthesis
MHVCIDVSPAVHRRAGLGRYAQELTAALLASGVPGDWTVFYNRSSEARLEPPLDTAARLATRLGDKPWRASVLLAHALGIPQDRLFPGIDLFHGTDHLLPRLDRARSVFTLHDLTFALCPETHATLNRRFLTAMMPVFLRRADRVIADSEYTRQDAVRLYGFPASRVTVVYPGVASRFRPSGPEQVGDVRRKYSLPPRFTLFVGTIEPRKNLTVLAEAHRDLRSRGFEQKLVIVGRKGWLHEGFFRRVHELGLEGEVLLPGFVADEDLPALYTAADLFVYPSIYEGFGLPVLEAMACGTPVVCSDASSLPEVVGDAALLFSPKDTAALCVAMSRALTDASLRDELRAKGLARAAGFTWERTAQQTLAVYYEALEGPRARGD